MLLWKYRYLLTLSCAPFKFRPWVYFLFAFFIIVIPPRKSTVFHKNEFCFLWKLHNKLHFASSFWKLAEWLLQAFCSLHNARLHYSFYGFDAWQRPNFCKFTCTADAKTALYMKFSLQASAILRLKKLHFRPNRKPTAQKRGGKNCRVY